MRQVVVSVVLVALAGALAFFLITRPREVLPKALAELGTKTAKAESTGDKSNGKDDSAASDAGPAATDAGPNPAGDKKAKVNLGRPLRVVSQGWDLIVPGLVANTKGAFSRRGLDVEFRSVSRLRDIEAALAAGGDTNKGADVAIVALPLLALAYENLSALKPELFWIVGFSRGRDALYARRGSLVEPPKGKLELIGDKERASTFFALFALDLAGVDLAKVKLLSDSTAAASTRFAAVDRSMANAERLKDGRTQLLSTTDATTVIPYVAIAPSGFLDRQSDVATAFGVAWLEGVAELQRDVPAAARAVAALEGTPEPVVLIKRLGQLDFVNLTDNAELFGLSGRGAISATQLFKTSFRIWREVGVISTVSPESAPIAPSAVSALVLNAEAQPKRATKTSAAADSSPLLLINSAVKSEDEAIEKIGTLAGLFSRSVIEVGFKGREKSTKRLIARAAERFGFDPARLVSAHKRSKRRRLVLAVMPVP